MRTTIYAIIIILLTSTASAASIMPVKCTDGQIEMTNEFSEGDDLCAYGTGFLPGETIDLYVVTDQEHYTPGEDYQDLSGEKETATTNEQGILGLKKLWENVKQGIYDLVADRNKDGKYDTGDVINDAKHDNSKQEQDDEEIEEVPEFGTIAALATLIGAGIIISKRRSK